MRDVDTDFATYVRARQRQLLRAAYLVCGDRQDAEDVVQDALERLALRWDAIRDEHPDAFVRRALYRDAVSSRRGARRKHPIARPELPPPAAQAAATRADLESALRQLSPRQRAVLVLRFFEDRSEGETADTLGIPVGTVTSHTHDALARIGELVPSLAPITAPGDVP